MTITQPMIHAGTISLGLIGLGNQGQEHLRCQGLCHEAKIVAGVDVEPQAREKARSLCPHLEVYSSFREMREQGPPLQGLILALPHHSHEAIWSDLGNWGLPILKEKPLGRTMAEALLFLEGTMSGGIPVRTALQRRAHPSYRHLKKLLQNQTIRELRGIFHLGKDPKTRPAGWRGDPAKRGGGFLLEGGYHLIDLATFYLGPMDIISANLWSSGKPSTPEMMETDAFMVARAGPTWVVMDTRLGGEGPPGAWIKKEEIQILTEDDTYRANREGVWKNGIQVMECGREWHVAMAAQLDRFADAIRKDQWDDPHVWDQGPVMRLIENAYALARELGPFRGGYQVER